LLVFQSSISSVAMDLSPAKRFKGRGVCVKHVKRSKAGRKLKREDEKTLEVSGIHLNSRKGFMKSIGSAHLVGGLFGNGRSSDCSTWSCLGEEQLARRRGDLQQVLSLHSRSSTLSLLGEGTKVSLWRKPWFFKQDRVEYNENILQESSNAELSMRDLTENPKPDISADFDQDSSFQSVPQSVQSPETSYLHSPTFSKSSSSYLNMNQVSDQTLFPSTSSPFSLFPSTSTPFSLFQPTQVSYQSTQWFLINSP